MYANTIISQKKTFLRSCLAFILAIFSIDKAQAQAEDISSFYTSFIDNDRSGDLSSLHMSFSEPIASALPETPAPKTDRQKSIARNVSQRNEKVGWYFSTTRGANFPNLNITTSPTQTNPSGSSGNWTGLDSLGSLLNLSNINASAGYKSSNFRLEGEVMLGNNPMRINRKNTTFSNNQITETGQQRSDSIPANCTANSFAMLINGYYDIDLGNQFKPFVGVGIGYSSTSLKDGNQDWGSNSGFAYQLKAGVGYSLSETQDIYLQYKYINLPARYVNTVDASNPKVFDTNFSVGNIEIGTRFSF